MVDQTSTPGSLGAGQQYPEDSNSDYTVICFIIAQKIALLETMTPVQVVTVHPGTGTPPSVGTVDVQLLVSMLDGSGNAVKQGIVYGIPYFRLQGGPWAVVCDPAENDFGYIVSASRDISKVKSNPGIQNPGSLRKYSFSDGIYMGGCLNETPAATIWLKSDGSFVITDEPGNVVQSSSDGIAITPASGGALTVNGPIHSTGSIIAGFGGADQIGMQTHEHPTAGSGAPSPPTPGT